MTTDGLNSLNLRYNYLNLLGKVESSADGSPLASYKWFADGTKAGATTADGTFGLEYVGSLIYKRNANNELELESTAFGGGRITVADTGIGLSYTPNYFISDHLSSTRVVVKPTIGGIEVSERNNFLPFGKRWETPSAAITDNRFRFSGKEEQELFNLPFIDFGARMYDPFIGRWTTPDPLAEKYLKWSPYAYVANNPARIIDIDGMFWGDPVKDPQIRWNRASNLYGENIRIYKGELRTHQGFDYYAPKGRNKFKYTYLVKSCPFVQNFQRE